MLVSNIMQVLKNLFGLNKKISADTIAFKDSSNNVDTLDNYLNNKTIYDSGSNNNGNWIRFTDGTMICTKTITVQTEITTPWGSLYESGNINLGDYAQSFIKKPIVSINNCYADNYASGVFIESLFNITKSNVGDVWLCRPNSRASASYTLDIIAIGKWK